MTTKTTAPTLTVLDQVTEFGLAAASIPGTCAETVNVFTKLVITGTEEQGRNGWADLTINGTETVGKAEFGLDAHQARQLAGLLTAIADELDARTA